MPLETKNHKHYEDTDIDSIVIDVIHSVPDWLSMSTLGETGIWDAKIGFINSQGYSIGIYKYFLPARFFILV